jgi:hypothetical protein
MMAPIRYAGPSSLPYILLFPHFLHVLFLCIFRLFFHIYGDLAVMVMQRSCLYCYIYDFDIDLVSFFVEFGWEVKSKIPYTYFRAPLKNQLTHDAAASIKPPDHS